MEIDELDDIVFATKSFTKGADSEMTLDDFAPLGKKASKVATPKVIHDLVLSPKGRIYSIADKFIGSQTETTGWTPAFRKSTKTAYFLKNVDTELFENTKYLKGEIKTGKFAAPALTAVLKSAELDLTKPFVLTADDTVPAFKGFEAYKVTNVEEATTTPVETVPVDATMPTDTAEVDQFAQVGVEESAPVETVEATDSHIPDVQSPETAVESVDQTTTATTDDSELV